MVNIGLTGVEDLNEAEKEEITRISEASYEKIKRKTKVDFFLGIVLKVHSKGDMNKKKKHFSVKASISKTVRSFEAESDGWDLNKAVHQALNALETEVEHTFHSSEQHA